MNTGRSEQLRLFVQAGMRTQFVWGQRDCCLWVCDWIAQVRGVDPAASLRGTYSSKEECDALLAAHGGLGPLADDLAASAGLAVTADPSPGDVAMVETKIGPALMLVTALGVFAWKSREGVLFDVQSTATKVWAV